MFCGAKLPFLFSFLSSLFTGKSRVGSGEKSEERREKSEEYKKKKPPLRLFLFGGGRWIRTTEVSDNRFTVCPLWPLGNSPLLNCVTFSQIETQQSGFNLERKKELTDMELSRLLRKPQKAEWSKLLLTLELVDGLEPPTC